MPKQLSEYTPQELQEIGKKVVQTRIKDAEKGKERNAIVSALVKAWKDGKIDIPGLPKPKE